ncbi:MAG: type I methionyl aminopeptidase [Candidatus Wildermuthbacteria bacterium RIFCSPLOWO2_01_FULL_48_29]|uniref:Methionine aminopeptidase n=2 Tax=Candidatus Wildermuthiibacteriota TaxID=1817923 RepID=A0A1G2RMT9_9BACT|nr:MAG: type I methionyl aminopeptidase [Candidatus Wildermuthbacteria bacterium RIFCSPHIGHO2_01_FULL_48_27b]OHA74164.1 MAG: type I methionyl aminopeptidase [Candidatus Wildermuthbacteria bacterium RIFCSPLOWO2_01_FULL_48_29]
MIPIKTPQEIAIMRKGGRILAGIMDELIAQAQPGASTAQLDKIAEGKILKAGAKPAFKNYQGFPATLCASVNEEVVHAIPSPEKILKEGDIITLDLGLIYKGYYSDMARTVPVGEIEKETARLVRVTREALEFGIKKTRAGVTVGDVGNTIQRFVEERGYGVVRELCGHGIGKELHEEPQVLNYGSRHTGVELKEGMVICIEPMVTMGDWNVKRARDGQTYITRDGSLSAHFEDTIAIIKNGAEVLTRP